MKERSREGWKNHPPFKKTSDFALTTTELLLLLLLLLQYSNMP